MSTCCVVETSLYDYQGQTIFHCALHIFLFIFSAGWSTYSYDIVQRERHKQPQSVREFSVTLMRPHSYYHIPSEARNSISNNKAQFLELYLPHCLFLGSCTIQIKPIMLLEYERFNYAKDLIKYRALRRSINCQVLLEQATYKLIRTILNQCIYYSTCKNQR